MEKDKPFIPSPLPVLIALVFYSFAILIGLVIILPALAIQGWVASILWGWFMVPFFKLPALSIPVAIGMRLCLRVMWGSDAQMTNKNDGNTKTERLTYSLVLAYIAPFGLLGTAYLVKMWF